MKSLLIVSAVFIFTISSTFGIALADHPPASIQGTNIELFERDHAFSGSILERPVLGVFEHNPFGAQIRMRIGEQTLVWDFKANGKYSGETQFSYVDAHTGQTKTIVTRVDFVSAQHTGGAEGLITLLLNQKDTLEVNIKASAFGNGHFQAPAFSAQLNGKPVEFAFTGEACLGYSSNLAMMILGAYAHITAIDSL